MLARTKRKSSATCNDALPSKALWKANQTLRNAKRRKTRAAQCAQEATPDLWLQLNKRTQSARGELRKLVKEWATLNPCSPALAELPSFVCAGDRLCDAVVRSVLMTPYCRPRVSRFMLGRPGTQASDLAHPSVFKLFAQWFPEHVVGQASHLVRRAPDTKMLLSCVKNDKAFCQILTSKQDTARAKEATRCSLMRKALFAMEKGLEFQLGNKRVQIVGMSRTHSVHVRVVGEREIVNVALHWNGANFDFRACGETLSFECKTKEHWDSVAMFLWPTATLVLDYLR